MSRPQNASGLPDREARGARQRGVERDVVESDAEAAGGAAERDEPALHAAHALDRLGRQCTGGDPAADRVGATRGRDHRGDRRLVAERTHRVGDAREDRRDVEHLAGCGLVVEVERHRPQAARELVGECVDVAGEGVDVERVADLDEHSRPHAVLALVVDADRDDPQAAHPRVVARAERDARRTGAERREVRRVPADALGKDQCRFAPAERLVERGERLGVAPRIRRRRIDPGFVLRTTQRHDAHRAQEARGKRVGEERRLAGEGQPSLRRQPGAERVDQLVRVVDDQQQRTALRNALGPRELDGAVVPPHRHRGDVVEESVQRRAHAAGAGRVSASAARAAAVPSAMSTVPSSHAPIAKNAMIERIA